MNRYSYTKLREVVFRFKDVDEIPEGFTRSHIITNPSDVYQTYKFVFAGLAHERFVAFMLDSANHVGAIKIVSEGTLNSSLVHPREVFSPAIHSLSAAIILAHNHPSGNPEPSSEDLQITRQLVEAGKILGIPIHDHIIFTEHSFTSFAERSLL
jgi:DNA repair protein RadC